jgi:hypothetical protein
MRIAKHAKVILPGQIYMSFVPSQLGPFSEQQRYPNPANVTNLYTMTLPGQGTGCVLTDL